MSEKYTRDSNINSVKIVQMIKIESLIGAGTASDPVRQITEYYTMDGQIVGRRDYGFGDFVSVQRLPTPPVDTTSAPPQ